MTRLKALSPEYATGKTKELFNGVEGKLGMVPNMMRTMGNSPATLEGYLNLSGALSKGSLGGKLGELIALTVAEINNCGYCRTVHTYIGEKVARIDRESLLLARDGFNRDIKIESALQFAKTLVEKSGQVNDQDVAAIKSAGYTDGEVGEIVANVALNVFTNYFNNTAKTEIDFPELIEA